MRPVHQGGEEALSLAPDEGTAKSAKSSDRRNEKVTIVASLNRQPLPTNLLIV